MGLHEDLIAAGLPEELFAAPAVYGHTILYTRARTPQEENTIESIINPVAYRQLQARIDANAIPNWATWTQSQWTTYFDANLANGHVTSIANLAEAKVMLQKQNNVIDALAKMVIAIRNHTRIIE